MNLFSLCWVLSFKDLWQDRKVSFCTITALMSIIAPLLLLFGLKQGVVTQLQDDLLKKPDLLQIRTMGNTHKLSKEWIDSLEQRDDVSFAIGLTRSLNTEAQAFKTERAAKQNTTDNQYIEIIPTKANDPLLGEKSLDIDVNNIAISYELARRLNAKENDPIFLRLSRVVNAQKQYVFYQANIKHILKPQDYGRAASLVPLELLLGIESFIDGKTDDFLPVANIDKNQNFANIRIFANSMKDVLALSNWLEDQNIKTQSQQSAIQNVLTINAVLGLIFAVIALTALVGGVVSLTGSFLANIDRKRYLISTLRLLGFNKGNIALYVAIQVLIITCVSFVAALAFYFIGSSVFNYALGSNSQISGFSTYLSLNQIIASFLLTILLVVIVAIIGAIQSTNIQPAESLREV